MSIFDQVVKSRLPDTKLEILKDIKIRFSPRVFSDEQINEADLALIFEAARWAPSGRNHQPWHFFWAKKDSDAFEKIIQSLPSRNLWANKAPVLIVACYDPTEPTDIVNKWATYDLGAATMSLVMQAQEIGLYCRQIGSFDTDKLKKLLDIKDPLNPFVIIAIGKIGTEKDYENADPEIVKKELSENTRKPIVSTQLL